jgi:hypothetical protein
MRMRFETDTIETASPLIGESLDEVDLLASDRSSKAARSSFIQQKRQQTARSTAQCCPNTYHPANSPAARESLGLMRTREN